MYNLKGYNEEVELLWGLSLPVAEGDFMWIELYINQLTTHYLALIRRPHHVFWSCVPRADGM